MRKLKEHTTRVQLRKKPAKALPEAVRAYNSGDMGKAERLFELARVQEPGNHELIRVLGNLQLARGAYEQAAASFSQLVSLPHYRPEDFCHLGLALVKLDRINEALIQFDRAIELRPEYERAFLGRGEALQKANRLNKALTNYQTLLRFSPDSPGVHFTLGHILFELGRHEEALLYLINALRRNPEHPFLPGLVAFLSLLKCDWPILDSITPTIAEGLLTGKPVAKPFCLFPLTDDPGVLLMSARSWVEKNVRVDHPLPVIPRRHKKPKIHVAYLSADFHEHATAHLMAQLFESHDRSRFEVTGISFGPDIKGLMRSRLIAGFDRFEDVRQLSDRDTAGLCRSLGVDIAVDLKGFLRDSRPNILAHRGAPVQINYLGMPGTMGASFIDYIIADRELITDDDLRFYSEKVIWMPGSYQVNDSTRYVPKGDIRRDRAGLPEQGFVFCSFNNNYKILPTTFNIWMQILSRTPGSVLWLLEDNPSVARNLTSEAASFGISPERLIFAKRVSSNEHLDRHALADLFIDTWPCNAHTTASDALWSGLPIVTRAGRSFASRVAASLLRSVGLSELITYTDEQYTELVVSLAHDPARVKALRQYLLDSRKKLSLFDCELFTQNIESAYQKVMTRYWSGMDPDHIVV